MTRFIAGAIVMSFVMTGSFVTGELFPDNVILTAGICGIIGGGLGALGSIYSKKWFKE